MTHGHDHAATEGNGRHHHARVLTVSDSVAAGRVEDTGGAGLAARLEGAGFVVDRRAVVVDGVEEVAEALRRLVERFSGLVVTTGGTGFSPRDHTPEATRLVIEREAPGLAEAMRATNPLGRLSRGVAGSAGAALVLNLPGSPTGSVECLDAVLDVLPHALDLLAGGNPHPAPGRSLPSAAGPRPGGSDDWVAISADPLPVAEASQWAVLPGCGAVVTFTGTVRDHSEDRPGVTVLEYSAYEEVAEARLAAVADEARRRWPELGRVALLHRTGPLAVTEAAVTVVVSAPHRDEAFDAARFCIDTLKETVPIWKRETWAGGTDWGTCDHVLDDIRPQERAGPASVTGPSVAR